MSVSKLFAVAALSTFACGLFVEMATASVDTIGTNGINSAGLLNAQNMPLNGSGVAIGQVETFRPGDLTAR